MERWFLWERIFQCCAAESAPDSITLYWERPQGRLGTTYEIFLKDTNHTEADFTSVGSTQKTHYTIENLQENTRYKILLKGIYQVDMALIEDESESVQIEKEIKQQTITVHTFNRSVVIDITKTPYNAVGNGKTLNTKAIQSAIDELSKRWLRDDSKRYFYDRSAASSQRYGIVFSKGRRSSGNF